MSVFRWVLSIFTIPLESDVRYQVFFVVLSLSTNSTLNNTPLITLFFSLFFVIWNSFFVNTGSSLNVTVRSLLASFGIVTLSFCEAGVDIACPAGAFVSVIVYSAVLFGSSNELEIPFAFVFKVPLNEPPSVMENSAPSSEYPLKPRISEAAFDSLCTVTVTGLSGSFGIPDSAPNTLTSPYSSLLVS